MNAALAGRLARWGAEPRRDWRSALFGAAGALGPILIYRVGPYAGYGATTAEAVNACADVLAANGWIDDRTDDERPH